MLDFDDGPIQHITLLSVSLPHLLSRAEVLEGILLSLGLLSRGERLHRSLRDVA